MNGKKYKCPVCDKPLIWKVREVHCVLCSETDCHFAIRAGIEHEDLIIKMIKSPKVIPVYAGSFG